MARFIEGISRSQGTLFPERLEEFICDDNPVRVIDAFVEQLDLINLGFDRCEPKVTGRPGYHPSVLLKLYIYGYLNRVQSSRRLEREAGRNVEVMWLTGRLAPDHKTIADFRKDNGRAIRKVCSQFVQLCRQLGLLATASVAIDGSKFKAVNNRDRNFTKAKMARRMKQIEESVARYLHQLDTADRQEPTEAIASRVDRLNEKIDKLHEEMARLKVLEAEMLKAPDEQISLADPDARSMATSGRGSGVVGYNVQAAVETATSRSPPSPALSATPVTRLPVASRRSTRAPRHHLEIRPSARRLQVADRRAAAPPAPGRELQVRDPGVAGRVVVDRRRDPGLEAGVVEGVRERVPMRHVDHGDRSAGAAIARITGRPVLDALEQRGARRRSPTRRSPASRHRSYSSAAPRTNSMPLMLLEPPSIRPRAAGRSAGPRARPAARSSTARRAASSSQSLPTPSGIRTHR